MTGSASSSESGDSITRRLWNTGSPVKPGDDGCSCGRASRHRHCERKRSNPWGRAKKEWIARRGVYHRARRRRDPLAPCNDAYNRLTSQSIACGKPVDDCSEKPVHLRCGREGKAVKNPGMFPCITPGINLARGADSL